MTATEKLMQKMCHMAAGETHVAPEALRDAFEQLTDDDAYQDIEAELRGSGEETGLPCPGSRHYESKAVAAQMLDGSWVGWTYWYGGGKHGEPGAVPWVEDAYDVTVYEVKRVVRVFERWEAGK